MKTPADSDAPAAGVNRLTNFIEGTLALAVVALVVGLVLRFGYDHYNYGDCTFAVTEYCRKVNAGWTVGTTMAEVSLTYLIVMGGIYGFIRLLGGGRLRGFFNWFWRGP